jgi:hypothetical protein
MPSLRNLRKLVIISAVIGAMAILPCVSTHASPNLISEEGAIKIPSQILNEERTLSIALPQDYDKSQKAYPVLYILDAEARNEFTDAVSTIKDLHAEGVGPQMIIVGIWNTNRNRDMIPVSVSHRPQSGGSQKFLEFITDELKPYVKQNYRTTDFSVLYGASNAGLFRCIRRHYSQQSHDRTLPGTYADEGRRICQKRPDKELRFIHDIRNRGFTTSHGLCPGFS